MSKLDTYLSQLWSPDRPSGCLKDHQRDSSQPSFSSSSSGELQASKHTDVYSDCKLSQSGYSVDIAQVSDFIPSLCHSVLIASHHFLRTSYPPPTLPVPPHLCCRAAPGGRWSRLYAAGGTVMSGSVSRRSPEEEDTSRLCSTPGSPASGDLLWCSDIQLGGTAAPGWFKWI